VNWRGRGSPDQVSADVTLVDGLTTPANQLAAFAGRTLLPGEERIREHYDLSPDARFAVWLWRMIHPVKLAVRYLLALVTIPLR
jgi:hypothetical protein